MGTFPSRAVLVLAALLPIIADQRLSACSTPVCQYALENWPPDPYEILVSCAPADVVALRASCEQTLAVGEGATANALLRFRENAAQAAFTAPVEVRFPSHPAGRPPVWTGALSVERLQGIVDSPVRAQLVTELLGGAAAVFLFLPAGDAAVDSAARARLQTALDELSRTLTPPPLTADDVPATVAAPPEPFRFLILDVSRQDPAEEFLRAMLLASEADLAGLREPMAFPVFGRGRALYALVGAGINREMLAEACGFLAGACSCEVKAQNPGVDLLLRADWSRVASVTTPTFVELPPLTSLEALAPDDNPAAGPALVAAAPVPSAGRPPPLFTRRALVVAGVAGFAVLAATLALLALPRRR